MTRFVFDANIPIAFENLLRKNRCNLSRYANDANVARHYFSLLSEGYYPSNIPSNFMEPVKEPEPKS